MVVEQRTICLKIRAVVVADRSKPSKEQNKVVNYEIA